MATTTPLHGRLDDRLAVLVIRVIAMAVQEDLMALDRLDTHTAGVADRTVAQGWTRLVTSLVAPPSNSTPVPPLPPVSSEVVAALDGVTEQECVTVALTLGEVSTFLSYTAGHLWRRIHDAPSAWRPEDWTDTLHAAHATARYLQMASAVATRPMLEDGLIALINRAARGRTTS